MLDELDSAKDCRRKHKAANAFSRSVRLTKKAAIDRVYRQASVRQAFGPLVFVGAPNQQGFARIGFALAKRHAPKAVCRNAIKRAVREWFRHRQNELPNYDYMVSLRYRVTSPQPVCLHLTDASARLNKTP